MTILKNFLKKKLVLLGLCVVLIIILWKMDAASLIFDRGYQAVFLTNNQVYFGRLNHQNAQFAKLSEVYYLQISQPLQQGNNQPQNPNINLVKLGGELHGPKDLMEINRDHILFVEDLRADSRVVSAIAQYKKGQ